MHLCKKVNVNADISRLADAFDDTRRRMYHIVCVFLDISVARIHIFCIFAAENL